MPRGSAISVQTDIYKTLKETEVKKSAEETPTLWTPGTGKRFFLQGIVISLNSTAGYWELFDNTGSTTETLIFGFNVKAVAATEALIKIDFPVGYESIKQGNILVLKASATTAKASIVVYGTEVA